MEEINATPQAQEQVAETTPQTIKVKYNHEEKEIPYDDAVTLIQKGLNYDKKNEQYEEIHEKYKDISESKALKILSQRAEKLGISADELAERLDKNISESEVKEFADAKGYSEEDARLIMEAQQIKAEKEAEKQRKAAEEQQKVQREIQLNEEIEEFRKEYDIDIEKDLPKEVVDKWINKRVPLIDAYEAYQFKKERKKVPEKVNEENAAASMGSVQSKGNAETVEFTAENVKKMTSEERKKYMPKLIQLVKEGKLQAW